VKGGERSSNFAKCEVPIREREIWTVRSRGLWTIDLVSRTHKFGFRKDEQANFARRKVAKRCEGLAPGHSEGSYGWRIREELAHARPLSGFRKSGESG
jgi:hypothetical protein